MEQENTRKYKLVDRCKHQLPDGRTLFRIEALKDFGTVKKGDLGGYVESYSNLSHFGDCWIYDYAKVFDNAQVLRDARVADFAQVSGQAIVTDNSEVSGNSVVTDHAVISGDAKVNHLAKVCDMANVDEEAFVSGMAKLRNKCFVKGNAKVAGYTEINDNVIVLGHAVIDGGVFRDFARIGGYAYIAGGVYSEMCYVGGLIHIYSPFAYISGNAVLDKDCFDIRHRCSIKNKADYIVFKNWWSSGRYFVYFRSENKYQVGCFFGTGIDLIGKAKKDSSYSALQYMKIVHYVENNIHNLDTMSEKLNNDFYKRYNLDNFNKTSI